MKKVVIIGTAYPYRGGLANYNERLAREFSGSGYDITIETFRLQYPSVLFPGKSQYSSEQGPGDLKIHRSINSINPLNWFRASRKIARAKPDLLVIKFWLPFMAPALGTIARRVKKKTGCTVISIADNIVPHEKRPGDHMLTKYFINSVDGFIVMSDKVKDDLLDFDPDKPNIFSPHPLYDNFGESVSKEEARDALGLDKEGKYMLFFGIIRDYKGLDILLQAMNDEKIRKGGIKLVVAGEFYTNPKPYLDYIAEKQLDNVVMKTEFIPDGEVYKYFSAADIVVQPYKHATQSGVTQIAYHFNKPMIVTNVGGLPELVPDKKVGYVISPDPSQIVDAITRFYEVGQEKDFIEGVKEEKLKFSWDYLLGNIKKLFESINSKHDH